MRLSVAMATYNGADFVIEQLDSIMKQTMPVNEVIIRDDKTKDDTVERINQYITENHFENIISIKENDVNLGYASNFMEALNNTTGDLIFFCDQDDKWPNNRIKEMTDLMEKHSEIKLLASEFSCFSDSDDALSVPKWEIKKFKGDKSVEFIPFKASNIPIGAQGCTMCLRRTFYDEIKSYWFKGWAHDEFFWKLALCDDGLYMYHQPTINRRLHANNVSLGKMRNHEKRIKFLKDLKKSHEATLKYALDKNIDKKNIKLLEKNIKATQLRIELMEDKKYFNTVKLILKYSNCYHKRRAIPVELKMALTYKK